MSYPATSSTGGSSSAVGWVTQAPVRLPEQDLRPPVPKEEPTRQACSYLVQVDGPRDDQRPRGDGDSRSQQASHEHAAVGIGQLSLYDEGVDARPAKETLSKRHTAKRDAATGSTTRTTGSRVTPVSRAIIGPTHPREGSTPGPNARLLRSLTHAKGWPVDGSHLPRHPFEFNHGGATRRSSESRCEGLKPNW